MAGIELATAYVTIVPSLKGAQRSIESQLRGVDLRKSGESIGRTLSKGMGASAGADAMRPLLQSVRRAEGEVQSAMGRSSSAMKGVEAAQRRLAEAREKYGDDSSQAARAEVSLIEAQSRAERAGAALATAQTRLADAQEELALGASGLSDELDEQARSLSDVSREAREAGSSLQAAGRAVQGAGRAVSGAGRAVAAAGGAIAGVGGTLTSSVTLPAIAAGAAVGTFAIRTASAAETTQISFTTMLGSEERALSMMEELAAFAAHTPFELSGLQSATRQLLAYGFTADDVIPMLTAVGDATAALGTGQAGIEAVTRALGQMQAKGKVQAEEMLQLTEQGIPAWQMLADTLGTDVATAQEKVTDGAVDSATAIGAVLSGMESRYGGMMEEQSRTVEGLMSNLSDAIEQPLMKLRDSSAYESFADSLGRVVESAGPFVEELLPHMERGLDVVSDVLGAASDAMDEFASMSDSSQERVLAIAAGAVAAGPALTVLGKGMELVGNAGDFVGERITGAGGAIEWLGERGEGAKRALSKLSDTFGVSSGESTALEEAVGGALGKLSAIPGPAKLAAVAVGGLLVSGIADFVAWSGKAAREAEVETDAIQVLRSSSRLAGEEMEEASEGPRLLGKEIYQLGEDIQENWQSIADLGTAFDEIDRAASAQVSQLTGAKRAVSDYNGQTDLSAQQLGTFRSAIETLNDQLGTNYEVVKDSGGAYYVMQDGAKVASEEIYKLIDAKVAEARASAQTQKLEKLYAEQAEQATEYARAVQAVSDAQQNYDSQVQKYVDRGYTLEQAAGISGGALDALRDARDHLTEVENQMSVTNDAVEEGERVLGNITASAQGAAEGFDALVQGSVQLNEFFSGSTDAMAEFADDLEASGVSLEDFSSMGQDELMKLAASWDGTQESVGLALAQMGYTTDATTQSLMASLEAAGVSTETLNRVGSENIAALAQQFGGNIDTMVWALSEYNAVPLVNKDGTVDVNDASLADAQGRLWTWNGSTFLDQYGTAIVDDTSLVDAQGRVWLWNGSTLVAMDTTSTVDGNAVDGSAEQGISDTNDATMRMSSKTVTDSVTGSALTASSKIWDTVRAINSLSDKSVTVSTTVNEYRNTFTTNTVSTVSANAAGGVRLNAAGGIAPRYHAGGAIATRAVPLDIVGEAGAEAIVPLTNRRYSQPFADVIAEGVARRVGEGGGDALARRAVELLAGIYRAVSSGPSARDFDRAVWSAMGRR